MKNGINSDLLIRLRKLVDDKSIQDNRNKTNSLLDQATPYFDSLSNETIYELIHPETANLKDIGIKMIDADFDDEDVNRIVETLRYIFYSVQKKRDTDINKKEINGKSEIGRLEFELEPDIVEYIGKLATALYNRKEELSSLDASVVALWEIGAKSCQVRDKFGLSDSLTSLIVAQQLQKIEHLKKNGKIIGIDYLDKLFNELKKSKKYSSCEPELDRYLDKFRTYYDGVKYDTGTAEVKIC